MALHRTPSAINMSLAGFEPETNFTTHHPLEIGLLCSLQVVPFQKRQRQVEDFMRRPDHLIAITLVLANEQFMEKELGVKALKSGADDCPNMTQEHGVAH